MSVPAGNQAGWVGALKPRSLRAPETISRNEKPDFHAASSDPLSNLIRLGRSFI